MVKSNLSSFPVRSVVTTNNCYQVTRAFLAISLKWISISYSRSMADREFQQDPVSRSSTCNSVQVLDSSDVHSLSIFGLHCPIRVLATKADLGFTHQTGLQSHALAAWTIMYYFVGKEIAVNTEMSAADRTLVSACARIGRW